MIGVVIGSSLADEDVPALDPSPTAVASPTATPSAAPSPSPFVTAPPTPTEAGDPEVTTASIASQSPPEDGRPAVEIDLVFPELTGLADGGVQERVNGTIRAAMEQEVEAFTMSVGETAGGDGMPPLGLTSRYTVGILTPGVLSVVLPVQTYTGGAHPYTVVRTFTFDLATGEERGLTDLFESGILERVSELVVERIDDEHGTGDWAAEGAAPTEEALGRFMLTPEHLQVWFDEYQVGPYAIGTPSVDVPYDELRDLVPADGLVASIVG